MDATTTEHFSTAQQLSCKHHPPLVWIWLELTLFADQVFSLKVSEEWQRLDVFTPQTNLHPELLGQVFDQQMFLLIRVRCVHVGYWAVRRFINSVSAIRQINTAKCLPGPQPSALHSCGASQFPKIVLLPLEGIFVTPRLAPPDRGCERPANTGAERKHEKPKKRRLVSWCAWIENFNSFARSYWGGALLALKLGLKNDHLLPYLESVPQPRRARELGGTTI